MRSVMASLIWEMSFTRLILSKESPGGFSHGLALISRTHGQGTEKNYEQQRRLHPDC